MEPQKTKQKWIVTEIIEVEADNPRDAINNSASGKSISINVSMPRPQGMPQAPQMMAPVQRK